MPDSSDSRRIGCPVCSEHTTEEALQSQGVVLTGVEALLNKDDALIRDVSAMMTDYDAHTAVSLLAMAFLDMCRLTGSSVEDAINHYRQLLNAAQARAV